MGRSYRSTEEPVDERIGLLLVLHEGEQVQYVAEEKI